MNIGAISSYVALVCLLTFLAMTSGLHAQTTTQSVVKVKKSKTAVASPVVVEVNSQATSDGDEEGDDIVTISSEGKDGQPRKLVVQRTVKNGKETVLLNGKEIDAKDGSLPKDVEQILGDLDSDSGNMVIKLNSSTMNVEGAKGQNKVMIFNSHAGSGGSKCEKIHIQINGLDSLCSTMVVNTAEMKKQCGEMKKWSDEMKEQLGEMKENISFRMDSLRSSGAWTTKENAFPMQFRVMDIDSTVSRGVFIYKDGDSTLTQSFDFNFDIPDVNMSIAIPDIANMPDMPMIKEFDTDNLGEIVTMFDAPETAENGTTEQKRYKVIVIEHPAGHDILEINSDNDADGTESDEPKVVQPSLPSTVTDNNSLRAEYFNVFPNPTPGTLNISFALEQIGGPVTVTVTDLLGNKVFDETLQNYSGQYHRQINLTEKARGTYIVSVGRDGQTLTRQVAVR